MEIIYHEGEEQAPETLQQERKKICEGCENYNKEKDSCSECSCLIMRKVFYLYSDCPIGKW
jgi:hypothetical protein